MEDKPEPVSLRNTRLLHSLLAKHCTMQKWNSNVKLSHDALIDTFLAIYDECVKDSLKKQIAVSYFVQKYKKLVLEIRTLRVCLKDFELKDVIGRGFFGEIRVVKEKITGDVFAMKTINKTKTLKNTSASLFEEERDILSSCSSKWLIHLQYAFQDAENLYLVMEYACGGDLMTLLEREGGTLSIDKARFYLAETLLAIHDLHRLGYVHRDLKPDNILLDRLGHVKLADFGSAARLNSDGKVLTTLPAGTPDYIAPEVLQALESKTSYGSECDLWSFGVVAYVLVFGSAPFSASRTSITYANILSNRSVSYPDTISAPDSLKQLINSLLKPVNQRLEYQAVRKHQFFLQIDFSSIRESCVPPVVPIVASPEDTSNFNPRSKDECEASLPIIEKQSAFSGKQLPFIGFTYTKQLAEENEKENIHGKPVKDSGDLGGHENESLNKKLLSALRTCKEMEGNVHRLQMERSALQVSLAKQTQLSKALKKRIEVERDERRQTEEKGLMIARQGMQSYDRETKLILIEWQSKVDELNDRLTEAHTINNQMASKNDRLEEQVRSLTRQVQELQEKEANLKHNMVKAREWKRRSVSELEGRLDRIQHQEEKWQSRVNKETNAKRHLEDKIDQIMNNAAQASAQWEQERAKLETCLEMVRNKLQNAEEQLRDTSAADSIKTKLSEEQSSNCKLRAKIASLERELSNAMCCLVDDEKDELKRKISELETELERTTQTKLQLESVVEKMEEQGTDNKNKLNELDRILEALQREVDKLERENALLKQRQASPSQLETKIEHQQKIILLENQIKKLEDQIESLRETAIINRQELRSAQSALWKTEKQLSDAKIDVRIAQREAKTAEQEVQKQRNDMASLTEALKKAQSERVQQEEVLQCLRKQVEQGEALQEQLRTTNLTINTLTQAKAELQTEYNSLRDKQLRLEKELGDVSKELKSVNGERLSLAAERDELKSRVSNLELNNAVLRETTLMMEEQLQDYEIVTSDLSTTLQQHQSQKESLIEDVKRLENEVSILKMGLMEEKGQKNKVDLTVENLRVQLSAKTELVDEMRTHLQDANDTIDSLTSRLDTKEKQYEELEMDCNNRDEELQKMGTEIMWLKEELARKLSDLYLLKEDNYRLNLQVEESAQYSDMLNNRIKELEQVITDLESFHCQRQMKDEATKQQQNKLISFLQTKLQDDRKKKTLATKLFGSRRRDPPSPQTPLPTSPRKRPTPSTLPSNMRHSPRGAANSPGIQQAVSQLVASPTSRMDRHLSLPRMHHRIPHRFNSQLIGTSGKCASCHDVIGRGVRASVCSHCSALAHPKCAVTAPKTCGLPPALAKHFVSAVSKPASPADSVIQTDPALPPKGWINMIMPGDLSWKRRFVELKGTSLLIRKEGEEGEGQVWEMQRPSATTLVSDDVTSDQLPNVAKQDLPFAIKVVIIPNTTCWPSECLYLLLSNASEKTNWIVGLQQAVTSPSAVQPHVLPVFSNPSKLQVNCLCYIKPGLMLVGAEEGLFGVHDANTCVQLSGVGPVHDILAAPSINRIILIAQCDSLRLLLSADFRRTSSNAQTAACAGPNVETESILPETLTSSVVSVYLRNSSTVYLAAATCNQLHFAEWSDRTSEFVKIGSIATMQPASCALFHNDMAIVGTHAFQVVYLKTMQSQDFLMRTRVGSTLIESKSYPIRVLQVAQSEFLLCFSGFGLFVDDQGNQTRVDLKWPQTFHDFEFCGLYLYCFGKDSVEVISLSGAGEDAMPTGDDTLSIATTATLNDTHTISLPHPKLLGIQEKNGVLILSNSQVFLLEGEKLLVNASPRKGTSSGSDSEFSFTSSINQSLDYNPN